LQENETEVNAISVPGLPIHWENYITCILAHMLFPLTPIIIELVLVGSISLKSLALAVSMYSIPIGVSSRRKSLFMITVIISIFYAVIYGIVLGPLLQQDEKSCMVEMTTIMVFNNFCVLNAFSRKI
jgi:hypothetical protein